MTFNEMLDDDLAQVFFNREEFASVLLIGNYDYAEELSQMLWSTEPIHTLVVSAFQKAVIKKELGLDCIFDIATEVILDSGSEYGESAATVPSALMKSEDADKIEHGNSLEIEGSRYILNYKDEKDVDLVRVYLEKRR